MMVHHLAHRLVEDAELRDTYDYTWHLIGCVDPDGLRLNEGWFAGPFTPRNYARHFSAHPPSGRSSGPSRSPTRVHYFDRALPETQMLMRVIDS